MSIARPDFISISVRLYKDFIRIERIPSGTVEGLGDQLD